MGLKDSFSEERTYSDDDKLASISFSGAAIGDLSYTWDANKNKTSESIGGVMSGYGFTAGYDAEDRLTSWDRADSNLDQSWDLSPVGDWNSITENSAVQNRTHGPVHEILTAAGQAVQHDPKGNMTQIPAVLRPGSDPLKLTWDFDNKLKAADTDNDGIDDVFYRWDALGRRVGRDDGSTHVIYFQDGRQTLADYPAGATASSPAYTYVYGSYIDEVVLRSGGSGIRYYHRNQQYSIIALTDATRAIVERYAYTPYGQVTFTNASGTVQTASASNNRYTYTGREWDAGLSLYHFRARMYDPLAGRFLSRDPFQYMEGENLYRSYFAITWTDPSGLAFSDPHSPTNESECRQWRNNASHDCNTNIPWYRWWLRSQCMRAVLEAYRECIDRVTGFPTDLINYGQYCGPLRYPLSCSFGRPIFAPGSDPIDAVDAACALHDCCVPTLQDWCDRQHHRQCNIAFCTRLNAADCSLSSDPTTCEQYRNRARLLTCGTLNMSLPLP